MVAVSDHKTPIEQALELFFYAPLGLLLNADEVVPQLIERGKQQVSMARMFGQFAVQQGQSEATKALGKLQGQAEELVGQLAGGRRGAEEPTAPSPAPTSVRPAPVPSAARSNGAAAPAVATLAIPDYDSLSASQVVPRLEGLSGRELDAVQRYEAAHRSRKTILNKIAQLQG